MGKALRQQPTATGQLAAAAQAAGAVRGFPFSCVLVGHVPKTGGTTLRRVLEELSLRRNQSVEICYNTNECEASATMEQIVQAETGAAIFHKCEDNQIVYGHGVTMDFAKHWDLPQESLARVVMIRNPIALIASYFKHHLRLGDDPTLPQHFEVFVKMGKLRNVTDGYMRWYLPDYTPADREDLPTLRKRVQATLGGSRVLTLLNENYEGSINALAKFLDASPDEKQAMEVRSHRSVNEAPDDYKVLMHKSSWDMLYRDIEPLELVYGFAIQNGPLISVEKRRRSPVFNKAGMGELVVPVDGRDAEP